MVGDALEILVAENPADEAVAAALSTVPTADVPDVLRMLVKKHGAAALPLLRRCLTWRPDWAIAAAGALAGLPVPEAAAALDAAETAASTKAVRTAIRRALYRLRQAGIVPPATPAEPRPGPASPVPRQAWMSAIDGTGARGCWVVLEGAFGERTLLSGIIHETEGLLDFAGGPTAKRRLDERLRAVRAESPLPWVEVDAEWALRQLAEAARLGSASGASPPGGLARWRATLEPWAAGGEPPIYRRVAADSVRADAELVEQGAALLAVPELAGWFLDPPTVQSEALELLQAKESRLVVTDQIKAERHAALIDRVIEAHVGGEARRLWQRRLEEEAWVLLQTGRPEEARQALATALALADPDRPARRIPFVRALVERSLEVAGEVALGRVPAEQVRRVPRPRRAAPVA